jgi:ATP-dependent Clp protease ATP-binding subunit ClpA
MSFKFTIPFYAFRLHLHSGGSLMIPLAKPEVLRIGQTLSRVAKQYATAFQKEMLNRGNLAEILNEYHSGDFIPSTISVSFPAHKNNLSYPAFSLDFPFYYNQQDNGYWGILPTLQMEAYAQTPENLVHRLEEAVKLNFSRNKRMNTVQEIVSALWYEQVELKQKAIQLDAPSPKELEGMMKNQSGQLLPSVAQLLKINHTSSYGQDDLLLQLIKSIKSEFHKNVVLVGPSGVGKTALVWELARQQKKRRLQIQIWETSASVLIKELMQDTGWQENLSLLCQELHGSNNILFIRNLMDLFEVGKSEGNSISMAEYLRPFLSNGSINILSECTNEEYAQIEIKAPNYFNFFQVINIEEPKEPLLSEIILNKINATARIKNLSIDNEAIKEAIRLNRRFTPYAGMPGRPIRFLESLLLRQQMEVAHGVKRNIHITKQDVLSQFCQETGLPQFIIDPSLPMNINAIRKQFNEQLFGQEAAVGQVSNLLATVKAALSRTGKPIASFLFVGPTGVGKTELAKILAQFMFGQRDKMTRFDMSEFSSPYEVQRLIGGNEGLLTSAIRKEPFSVLLFDEIEKADSSFFDLLLQLLSEGRLTDNQGKLTNFCSTIIIMTSNIGAQALSTSPIGWQDKNNSQRLQDHFMTEVQKYFRPELYNRIDQIIPFAPLDSFTVRFVVEREIELLKQREGIQYRRMSLKIEDEVLDVLAEKGYHPKYGARHLQRTIREFLTIPLAKSLNSQDIDDQLDVVIHVVNQKIQVEVTSDPLGLELLLEEYGKISSADHASNLRRRIEKLIEGHFYIQLLNEIHLLERNKKDGKQQFWKDKQQSQKYTYFLETKASISRLLEKVDKLETALGLSCVDTGHYDIKWADELENAEEQFFQLKTNLYSRISSETNRCYMGLYGSNPQQILQFYLPLLQAKEFDFKAYSIWYREAYYNEIVLREEKTNSSPQARKEYIKSEISFEKWPDTKPEQENDLLLGIELAIHGTCAWTYLEDEDGIQKWTLHNKEYLYCVKVENTPFTTPKRIHRKEFYQVQPIRRHLEAGKLKDTLYKLNREYNKPELQILFLDFLNDRFRRRIEEEIL